MLCLHQPIPVRSLFKHIHSGQGNVEPLARDSFGSSNNLLATVCRWADHAVTLAVAGFVTRGSVECMKLCRDFNHLCCRCVAVEGGVYRHLSVFLSHAELLLWRRITGGAIPANR